MVVTQITQRGRADGLNDELRADGIANTISSPGGGGRTNNRTINYGSTIRRFTPLECERLQGFPDGWTCLCLPLDAWDEAPAWAMDHCKCPDGPRYRALGNAVTATVPRWLASRIAACF
jgi:DNA (cytosine-5)-methyltransferase 1